MENGKTVSLLHFLPKAPINPTSLHSLTPVTGLVSHSRHMHFNSQYSRITLARSYPQNHPAKPLASPSPLFSIPHFLEASTHRPLLPRQPQSCTHSLLSWGGAKLRGEVKRGCETSGIWRTEEGSVLAPTPTSRAAREQKKNRPNCVCVGERWQLLIPGGLVLGAQPGLSGKSALRGRAKGWHSSLSSLR